METFKTEFNFVLPGGYLDRTGQLQKEGTMRLSTAADEILPMRDPRVRDNPSYLPIILLSRVVTRLGGMDVLNTDIIESLFAADFAYLQEMYNRINGFGADAIPTACPACNHEFDVPVNGQEPEPMASPAPEVASRGPAIPGNGMTGNGASGNGVSGNGIHAAASMGVIPPGEH